MKNHLLSLLVLSVPVAVYAQDVGGVASIAREATAAKDAVQARYMGSMDEKFKDKLATQLILRNQSVRTLEFVREYIDFPELGDNSKRFNIANLQGFLNIYMKSQNTALPQDLQDISKNAHMALKALISLEEERATRQAHNPYAPVDTSKENEEQKELLGLKSQYDTYLKKLGSVMLEKYGVNSAEYQKQILIVINAAVKKVQAAAPENERKEYVEALLKNLSENW